MTVLSTFLKPSLIFLFNSLKKHWKLWYSPVEKRRQRFNCQKHSLKGQSRTKSPVKPTWSLKNDCFKHIFEILIKFPIQ